MDGANCLAISDAHVQFNITRLGCRNLPKTEDFATSYKLLPLAAEQELQDLPALILTFAAITSLLIFDTY